MGIEKAALVGTSHGGRIAIQAAHERPARVSALVLAGSGLAGHLLEIEGTPEHEARWEAANAAGDVKELTELDLGIWAPMGADDELRAMFSENAEVSNAEDPGTGARRLAGWAQWAELPRTVGPSRLSV